MKSINTSNVNVNRQIDNTTDNRTMGSYRMTFRNLVPSET